MEFEDAVDYVTEMTTTIVAEITTKFGCTPDDMMMAMYEQKGELWEYIDRTMSWAAITDFATTRNDPSIMVHLNFWMREYSKHCSCAVYRSHGYSNDGFSYKLGYQVYFPSEKHKAKFILAFAPF